MDQPDAGLQPGVQDVPLSTAPAIFWALLILSAACLQALKSEMSALASSLFINKPELHHERFSRQQDPAAVAGLIVRPTLVQLLSGSLRLTCFHALGTWTLGAGAMLFLKLHG